jgi:hypothetical protein
LYEEIPDTIPYKMVKVAYLTGMLEGAVWFEEMR